MTSHQCLLRRLIHRDLPNTDSTIFNKSIHHPWEQRTWIRNYILMKRWDVITFLALTSTASLWNRRWIRTWVNNYITWRIEEFNNIMTSSNGNIFRVTGPLCGEFAGPGEFPTQRPVTRSFHVFFDLRLNKRLSKQPWGWWFETPSWSLWRHCNKSSLP